MNIYFNKGMPNEEVITEEEVLKMDKQQLKNLKSKCQAAMGDVALKRDRFKVENDLEKSSKEFFKKMNTYKLVMNIYHKAILWLSEIEKNVIPKEVEDKEHWLWCYYQESMKMLTEDMVQQITEMADTRAKVHIEFEKWEYKV